MREFSDEELRKLLTDTLEPSRVEALMIALESNEELRDRLEQLAGLDHIIAASTKTTIGDHLGGQNVPNKIDEFRIIQMLGRGGMGTVFLAEDELLKRKVALKLIVPAFRYSEAFREQFDSEAEIAAKLDHPNLVPIHKYGQHNKQPYLVMKYVDGPSLAERLRTVPKLSPAAVCRIIRELSCAIKYAHGNNILHCDIKPANILLNSQNSAFLTDFGIARLLSQDAPAPGTPAYQAPELADREHTKSSDLYALGKVISELSTHYTSPRIRKLIGKLCHQDPSLRQLADFEKLSTSRPAFIVILATLAVSLIVLVFLVFPTDSAQEASSQPFSIEREQMEGEFHLTDKLTINQPLSFFGKQNASLTTGETLTISADISFENVTFYYQGQRSLFLIEGGHELTFTNCRFHALPCQPPQQMGSPLLAVSGGGSIRINDCQIDYPGGIALGSYPRDQRQTDFVEVSNSVVQSEVTLFRARSGGNTNFNAHSSEFSSNWLLSQNARSGQITTMLDHCSVSGKLLFLPEAYPHPPQKTLNLRAKSSTIPQNPPEWAEFE